MSMKLDVYSRPKHFGGGDSGDQASGRRVRALSSFRTTEVEIASPLPRPLTSIVTNLTTAAKMQVR